jgi:hypothetical protein
MQLIVKVILFIIKFAIEMVVKLIQVQVKAIY